jgi:hypothetical protein
MQQGVVVYALPLVAASLGLAVPQLRCRSQGVGGFSCRLYLPCSPSTPPLKLNVFQEDLLWEQAANAVKE